LPSADKHYACTKTQVKSYTYDQSLISMTVYPFRSSFINASKV
jgi:hypothetical protein